MEQWAQSLVDEFRRSLAARSDREPRYSAQLDYDVVRNDDSAVSILFSYWIYTGGAHPNSVTTAFNFLMPDGVRVFLPDLIGDDGIQRVSDIAIADLRPRLTGPNGMSDAAWVARGAGPTADNFESFEWLPDQLVLHFDPYAVAAYAAGPQEVHIPLGKLQDVLRPDPRVPLPSFDCAAASTAVEHAICSDMVLAQLDRRMAEAFAMRVRLEALSGEAPRVRPQQVAWLAERDAACADQSDAALVSCLKGEYAARVRALWSFQ
jgi:uncharacterized protein YecT (DUF1311 family)